MSTLPLGALRFGHEAEPPINARRNFRDAEVESLAAMIAAQGLINALQVKEIDGQHFVAAGNRRLAALQYLSNQAIAPIVGDVYTHETPIRVEFIPSDVNALEISQAENFAHLPPHAADMYETFARLAETMAAPEIALHFGIEEKRVAKFLALGKLHPDIISAWREDNFGVRDSVDIVRAFTLAPSVEEQKRVFDELRDQPWGLQGHRIRKAFGADGDAGRFVTYVGREAYEAAGGVITEDLFGTEHIISDPALARKLASEKLDEECSALTALGWNWAERPDKLPESARYNWSRIDRDEERVFTPEEMGQSGCIVSVDREGQLEVSRGYLKPEAAKKNASAEKKAAAQKATNGGTAPANEKEPVISAALMERLSQQFTLATQQAVIAQPMIGLAAMTAGILATTTYQPMRVRLDGYSLERPPSEAFRDAFDRLFHMEARDLLVAFAHAIGPAFDMLCHSAERSPLMSLDNVALVDAFEPVMFNEKVREQFDFEDYCKSAPKGLVLKAIAEGVNADEARKLASKPKPDIVAFALNNVKVKEAEGWLPPALRSKHYDGPTEAKAAPAAAEKALADAETALAKIKPLKPKKKAAGKKQAAAKPVGRRTKAQEREPANA